MSTPETEGFDESFKRLRQSAEAIRQAGSQSEPKIDGLYPLVDQTLRDRDHCLGRINAVRRLLSERLDGAPAAERTS